MNAGRSRSRRLPDLRPASPGQLALVGLALWLMGALVPGLNALAMLGIGALVVAAVSHLVRPRRRISYWRGRPIDLGGGSSLGHRFYRLLYRS